MSLESALRSIGATIAQRADSSSGVTLFLRISPDKGDHWAQLVQEVLLFAIGKDFKLDVSKKFFVKEGSVVYLWRLQYSGDEETRAPAVNHLESACREIALANTTQLESFPLVGRVSYTYDPSKGKIKGAHDYNTEGAPQALVAALSGGVVQ